MADHSTVIVRVADYAPVKAVIEAAEAVVSAQGDLPWTLSDRIEELEQRLRELPQSAAVDSDDAGEGWEG